MGVSQSNTSFPIFDTSTWVRFENNSFAQGFSRLAYRGKYHGECPREGEKCVVKVYKKKWHHRLNEHVWKADDRASRRAQEMAKLFKEKHLTTKQIDFIIPEIVRINNPIVFQATNASPPEMIPQGATVAIERYLEGEYVKFLSNSSWVNRDVRVCTAEAFSHFTYHESNGSILVTDLQGVCRLAGYELTDPAIHSIGKAFGYYGPTDMGVFGVMKFFKSHVCNDLCRGLMKPSVRRVSAEDQAHLLFIVQSTETKAASSYTYELQRGSGRSLQSLGELHEKVQSQIANTPVQEKEDDAASLCFAIIFVLLVVFILRLLGL